MFSARPPRRDKELADANERTRRAFARDINDQRALAFDPVPRRKRGGMWMVWTRPGIALSSYSVPAGATIQWKATGPDGFDYVLAVDSSAVTGGTGVPVQVDSGTAVTPRAFRMANCEGAGLGFDAPPVVGQHFVRLFEKDGERYVQVAQVPLAVR